MADPIVAIMGNVKTHEDAPAAAGAQQEHCGY
jgi:hypothetical protein